MYAIYEWSIYVVYKYTPRAGKQQHHNNNNKELTTHQLTFTLISPSFHTHLTQ